MRFSIAAFALCAFETASGVAIEPRQALPCTPGLKLATYNDLPAGPIDNGNTGLTTPNFNPYLDLNYTRFSVIESQQPGNNVLFYTLSQLSSSPLGTFLSTLGGLIGPNSVLPPLLAQPTIVGDRSPTTQFKINSFDFGCSVRTGTSAVIVPFSCQIKVQPIEPARAAETTVCTFNADQTAGAPALTTCTVNGLLPGRGYKFSTVAKVSAAEMTRIGNLVDATAENFIVTAFDNLSYLEVCL